MLLNELTWFCVWINKTLYFTWFQDGCYIKCADREPTGLLKTGLLKTGLTDLTVLCHLWVFYVLCSSCRIQIERSGKAGYNGNIILCF